MRKQLTKSSDNVVLTGTLAGIAEWLGIDPTIVRVIYVIASVIFIGSPIFLYIVLSVLIPSGKKRQYGHQNMYNKNTRNPNEHKQRKQAEKVNDDDWSDF